MNILDTVGAMVQGAVNLKVVTLVGDAGISGEVESPTVDMPKTGLSMVTNINLVAGDITSSTSPDLLAANYADVRSLHAEMVAKAQDMVDRNVDILVKIFKTFGQAAAPQNATAAPAAPAGGKTE